MLCRSWQCWLRTGEGDAIHTVQLLSTTCSRIAHWTATTPRILHTPDLVHSGPRAKLYAIELKVWRPGRNRNQGIREVPVCPRLQCTWVQVGGQNWRFRTYGEKLFDWWRKRHGSARKAYQKYWRHGCCQSTANCLEDMHRTKLIVFEKDFMLPPDTTVSSRRWMSSDWM